LLDEIVFHGVDVDGAGWDGKTKKPAPDETGRALEIGNRILT
jgi:hypothetical protein